MRLEFVLIFALLRQELSVKTPSPFGLSGMLTKDCTTGTPIYVLYHQSWRQVTFSHCLFYFLIEEALTDNRKYSVRPSDLQTRILTLYLAFSSL